MGARAPCQSSKYSQRLPPIDHHRLLVDSPWLQRLQSVEWLEHRALGLWEAGSDLRLGMQMQHGGKVKVKGSRFLASPGRVQGSDTKIRERVRRSRIL